jgi:hypothetical protein
VSTWASFAESDEQAENGPQESPADQPEGKVEDLAVGRLRLWLRGVFGGGSPREDG